MTEQYDTVICEIGSRDDFSDDRLIASAQLPRLVHVTQPKAELIISVGGYDADPRELWDIPEAVDYIQRWAIASGVTDWQVDHFRCLSEGSVALLVKCEALLPDHPFVIKSED